MQLWVLNILCEITFHINAHRIQGTTYTSVSTGHSIWNCKQTLPYCSRHVCSQVSSLSPSPSIFVHFILILYLSRFSHTHTFSFSLFSLFFLNKRSNNNNIKIKLKGRVSCAILNNRRGKKKNINRTKKRGGSGKRDWKKNKTKINWNYLSFPNWKKIYKKRDSCSLSESSLFWKWSLRSRSCCSNVFQQICFWIKYCWSSTYCRNAKSTKLSFTAFKSWTCT